jgi:hypothetical protein
MDHHIWLQEWLLSHGFIASASGPYARQFARPLETGDSLYVQLNLDDKGFYTLSIHSDTPHSATSTGLKLPTNVKHAAVLLWFHGLAL